MVSSKTDTLCQHSAYVLPCRAPPRWWLPMFARGAKNAFLIFSLTMLLTAFFTCIATAPYSLLIQAFHSVNGRACKQTCATMCKGIDSICA